MGGRGTFSKGLKVKQTYETIGIIEGVKVLKGLNGNHTLPEESNTSKSYILLDENGNFKKMRIYNENHEAILDIDYHVDSSLNSNGKKILHYHNMNSVDNRDKGKIMDSYMKEQYKKYLKGIEL